MPKTYTQNLGVTKPADGEEDGVWGDIVNDNMNILDRATNGSVTLTLTGTSSTLTTSNGILSDGQFNLLVLAGTPSGTHTITIAPNTAQKIYYVRNTTAQSVVFTQGSGGNITVATGDSAIIYTNGVGAASAVNSISDHFALSSVRITGGSIDGVVIGGTSAAAGTFTSGTFTSVTSPSLTNAGTLALSATGANIITASTNGSERIRVTSAGNVGIGTTTPGALLDVNGTMQAQKLVFSTTNGQLEVRAGNTISFIDTDFPQVTTVDAAVRFFRNTNTSGVKTLRLFRGDGSATEDVRISSGTADSFFGLGGGAVGIGTASPTRPLHIVTSGATLSAMYLQNDTGSTAFFNRSQDTGLSTIYFGDTTDFQAGFIQYGHTLDNLLFRSAGAILFQSGGSTERMRIDSTGNVGIGTTTPVIRLDVRGPSGNGIVYMESTTGNSNRVQLGAGNGFGYIDATVGTGSTALAFQVASTERMRLDQSGNLGVGTASPTNFGATYRTVHTLGTATTSGGVFRTSNSDASAVGDFLVDASIVTLRSATNVPLTFHTNSIERMRLDTAGNVGIGITSTDAQLHVSGAAQTTAALTDAGTRGGMIRVSDTGSALGSGGAVLFANGQGDAANSAGFAAIKGLLQDGGGNTTGNIAFSTRNATSDTALTERFRIGVLGQLGIGGANFGTAGQVLTSGGPSAAPSWTSAAVGSVTSVAVSGGTTGLTTSGGPITSSGTITIAGTLAVANGGTGATDAATARTNLGLGTMATQASTSVSITGGSISGITDLAVADGGTGASDAATARTNLGLGTMATQGAGAVAITGGTINGTTIGATTAAAGTFTTGTFTTGSFALGAVGTPSITFTGDTNTGIFSPAADTIAFVEGGAEAMRIDSSGNVGVGGTANASTIFDLISTTKGFRAPSMTTTQRDAIVSPATGLLIYNTTLNFYQVYNGTTWTSVGGGATGGGSNQVFYENDQTVTTNYTITTNKNAMSAGPITINAGVTVTVPSGSVWSII